MAENLSPDVKAIKRGPIPPARFHDAANDRNIWNVSPFAGTVISDVLKPEYWASVANKLRPFDRIEVTPEDSTWWAELMVRSVSSKSVVVHLLMKVDFAKAETPPADAALPYEIDYTPATKWRVRRRSDNALISENHLNREQAQAAAAASGAFRT